MENPHVSLTSRRERFSLCSDADPLWEMDDVDAGEPSVLPGTAQLRSVNDSWDPINGNASRGRLSKILVFPDRQARPLSPRPGMTVQGVQWPFVPPQTAAEQFESMRAGAQVPAGGVSASASVDQQQQDVYKEAHRTPPFEISPTFVTIKPPEMSFMESYSKGDATICFTNDKGEADSITGINIKAIQRRCPLLAAAFESRIAGPQLHLEILTAATAIPFLRYLYTGSYALVCRFNGIFDHVPTSLLLHCQLYQLGMIYDLPQLVKQAYVNVVRQCEFGCSSPNPPIQLPAAIKFAYANLKDQARLLNTIVSYCVACFLRHDLVEDEEFKRIAFELKPFHQALCRESMNREFENETAFAIIQMPFKQDAFDYDLSREDAIESRMQDFVYHYHHSDGFDDSRETFNRESDSHALVPQPGDEHKSTAFRSREQIDGAFEVDIDRPTMRQEVKAVPEGSSTCSMDSMSPIELSPHGNDYTLATERTPGQSHSQATAAMNDDIGGVEDAEMSSESGYEIVPSPAFIKTMSSGYVSDLHTPSCSSSATVLPVQGGNIAVPLQDHGRPDGPGHTFAESSDSEWSLI